MKPAAVDYARPRSLSEALELLARPNIEARVIAGGQSLVAMMNLRVASPGLLVDSGRLQGFRDRDLRDAARRRRDHRRDLGPKTVAAGALGLREIGAQGRRVRLVIGGRGARSGARLCPDRAWRDRWAALGPRSDVAALRPRPGGCPRGARGERRRSCARRPPPVR